MRLKGGVSLILGHSVVVMAWRVM